MRLWAISDLHVNHRSNREALERIEPHPGDWLILAGDIGERTEQLRWTLQLMSDRFERLVWVPGNHELWTLRGDETVGVERYLELIQICHEFGVLTPEDPYPRFEMPGEPPRLIAPMFLLYDYSFRPQNIPVEKAVEWAVRSGVLCADEQYITPSPYTSKVDWCADRVRYSEQRLEEAIGKNPDCKIVLVNHFPLRADHATLWRIPRFSIWCGTRLTEDWHKRFPLEVVVYGHLHIRGTRVKDGVRFEEVSLGYPRDWDSSDGAQRYLRRILPLA